MSTIAEQQRASRLANRRHLARVMCFLLVAAVACGGGGAVLSPADAPRVALDSIAASPASVQLPAGDSTTIVVAAFDDQRNPLTSVTTTFSSSDAAVVFVSPNGVARAVGAGAAIISVKATAGTISRTVFVPVSVLPSGSGAGSGGGAGSGARIVTTSGVSFVPSSITISAGESVEWRFAGATHNVTFGALKPAGGNIPDTQPGNAVSRTFATPGTYDYQCTWHSGMTGRVIVAGATAPSYTTLAVTPQTPSIDLGARVTIAATALDQFGNPMTGLGVATFATSNAAIATVDAQGSVTGVAGGTATITASLTRGSITHTASATVTVVAPQANTATVETPSLPFSPQSVTIGVGGSVTWRFGGSTHNVTFGALKPTGGNISDTSPGNAVSRTFTTAGTYDYQCTRHNGMTGRVVVQATDPGPGAGTGTLASVSATPASVVLAPNGTARIVVTPRDASGAPLTLAATPTFVSSDTRVATVSGGLVTAVAAGEATITVSITSDGVTRTTTVAITVAAPAATIGTSASQFTPQEVTVRAGQTVLFQFSGASHNVTFKELRPTEGNIPDSAPGTSATRTFSATGDYDFYCTWHSGMKGRIRVQ